MKQGGDTNTIAVVNGVKDVVGRLLDVPPQLKADVVFDQSLFVKHAIETLLDEGGIGLVLTGLMVLVFLGSLRATVGVFLAIPMSVLAAIIALYAGGSSINTMILAGFALVFSRLIDNAVIVLENIFRHLEMGEPPAVAAEKGGEEVSMAVLAATLTSSIVFFPVTFLYGVSRFLFSALALAVVLALFASYFVAMTVVPLFCARFLTAPHHGHERQEGPEGQERRPALAFAERFNQAFGRRFEQMLVVVRAPRPSGRCAGPRSSSADHRGVRGQPAALSVARRGVLPAHRRRPVRHERQGAVGQPPRGHDATRSTRSRRWCAAIVDAGRSRARSSRTSACSRASRRSTRATPARTRPPCRWR